MSLIVKRIVKRIVKPIMKVTSGESLLRMDADVSDGSRLISLGQKEFLIDFILTLARFLRGMDSKLW